MRIVVDINHPAHVHYFKNFIRIMKEHGHEVMVTASTKQIIIDLLDIYKIPYIGVGQYGGTIAQKGISLPLMDIRYLKKIHIFEPDILIGFGSIRAAHSSFILKKPCINFEDTEHSVEQIVLYKPFVTAICTPTCFTRKLGPKQIRFNGYMELASLHPNYFTPNPAVLGELGLTENDRFIIVRFVSWEASHDVGQHGIRDKVGLVKALEQYGRVLITSEGALPPELQPYQIRVSPEKLHDLLYYATLYVGEGGTTASEAAMVGTHAIHISTTAKYCGAFSKLKDYQILWTTETDEKVKIIVNELFQNEHLRQIGKEKRKKIINESIDVTAFMVWLVENYPSSAYETMTNPNINMMFSH